MHAMHEERRLPVI